MGENIGLSSERAFDRLFHEAKLTIAEWYSVNVVNKLNPQTTNKIRAFSRYFCTRTFIFIRISLICLIIGSADIDNNVTYSSAIVYLILLLYTVFLEVWQNRVRDAEFQTKYRQALDEIEALEKNRPKSFTYSSNQEAITTDDFSITQSCFRDGCIVEVPRLLLVKDDIIVFRPGQIAPCDCETFDGNILAEGAKLEWNITSDRDTNAIQPLQPIYARVTSFPIKTHLEIALSFNDISLQFDYNLQYIIHNTMERLIIPLILTFSILASVLRFIYSDDNNLFGTRFVFAVPFLTIFPLLIIQLPLLLYFIKTLNNRKVIKELGMKEGYYTPKDLVAILSSVTGTSFVDKKGVLSSAHPSIEKVVFAASQYDESGADASNAHLEVLNLSSEQNPNDPSKWELSIDEPNWSKYLNNMLPLSFNLLLNSCKQSQSFHRFLDHLSVVTLSVPRTIATANRRCVCQLPALMGLSDKNMEQFKEKEAQILGIYKRQPGEAPLPGLTKHRTPMEMAFCTIHDSANSLHSHLACQGTANLVLDACTHVWNEKRVIPMTNRFISSVKDFYQRHSMTGHCLAVSYKPIFQKLSEKMNGKFVEIPLNREQIRFDSTCPRSQSIDSIEKEDIYTGKPIENTEQVIEECFTGHVLCGLVVLHYETLPPAVNVIEKLDSICVRPVYFSNENELRSRVFAEKLGIEAGWNCHISLADEPNVAKKIEMAYEQFVEQKPTKPRFLQRNALSESNLEALDCESLARGSPSLRKMSVLSTNVGPIPNIARLPTGIRNVRPHIEHVDNVPLLVGLFTDSTTCAIEEMIDIMQENGEVVMIVGSSRNMNNSSLFIKSNISICVDEIEEPSCRIGNSDARSNVNEISSRIIALSADFHINHRQLLKVPSLIVSCRHRMASVRHSLLFLLYSSLLLSLLNLTSTFFFLPILFTHSQIILSTLLHIPTLFLASIFTLFDPSRKVIRIAPKNSDEVPKVEKEKTVSTFLLQFLPTVVYLNMLFFFMLINNSNIMCSFSDISCIFNTDGSIGSMPLAFNETSDYTSLSTDTIRHIMGLQTTTCLCFLSSSFVFGFSSIWVDNPFRCLIWDLAVTVCILSQIGYSYLRGIYLKDLFSLFPLIFLIIWITIIVIVNELIKIRRIRQFTREQRRTKFDFDTKLGMNSPY